jgi:prepilin-type N-terminal cleavage/methylation domain-containing protein
MLEVIPMKSNSLKRRTQSDTAAPSAQPSQFILRWLARPEQTQNGGFTLIESLVAIIILSLTVVSVLPPIFWATATRVQNRRAEQAVQLAQSEIDRVRVAVERNSITQAQLPPKVGAALRPDAPAPSSIIGQGTKLRSSVPGCNVDDGTQATAVTQLILVDTDPEAPGQPCKPEFMIQTFRGTGKPLDDGVTAPDGFVMGVRVYSIVASVNSQGAALNPGVEAKAGNLRATNGLGTQRIRPLAVQYSTIVKSNTSGSLAIYRQLCEVAGDACAARP